MNAIEKYKFHKKADKIWDFFEKEHYEFIIFAKMDKIFLQILAETVTDFMDIKKNIDYRYYPWAIKIKEKKKEMLGF